MTGFWRSKDVLHLNLQEFLTELCEQFTGIGFAKALTCAVASVAIPTDEVIPFGLLVNELVTNGFKYASPQKLGDVHVSLVASGKGLRLEVRDRGPGLP